MSVSERRRDLVRWPNGRIVERFECAGGGYVYGDPNHGWQSRTSNAALEAEYERNLEAAEAEGRR